MCLINYGSDIYRYIKYSQIGKNKLNNIQLRDKIIAASHVIEKGLSLKNPRPGFGKEKIETLKKLIKDLEDRDINERKSFAYRNAVGVLNAYQGLQSTHNQAINASGISDKNEYNNPSTLGGVIRYDRNSYQKLAYDNTQSSIASRYSLRQFSEEPIDEETILKAVQLSPKTPSVCNRQSWRVFWAKSPDAKKTIRLLQNGNRGFGEQADSFLVITTDLHSFFGIEERNQSFIDGGMFAMTLLMALHSMGVGTCALNWTTQAKKDRDLRKKLEIPKSLNIIAIIAIGSIPENFTIAKSERKPLDEILHSR